MELLNMRELLCAVLLLGGISSEKDAGSFGEN
jgi:hypothetical protein